MQYVYRILYLTLFNSIFPIAEEFDLPFVPPYLAHNGSFEQGANFAVAGATALDFAFFVTNNLSNPLMFNSSLNVQLGWFSKLKPSLCKCAKGFC
jgi:hypothetical protein